MSHIMKDRYQQEIVPALMKSLNLDNIMEVPRIQKVVVNIGVGEALDNAKALDAAVGDLTQITGQKPIITKARVSIANFKLREGRAIGVKVTLRGDRMWAFLDRLMNIALPRVRDFRGVSSDSFDGRDASARVRCVAPRIGLSARRRSLPRAGRVAAARAHAAKARGCDTHGDRSGKARAHGT